MPRSLSISLPPNVGLDGGVEGVAIQLYYSAPTHDMDIDLPSDYSDAEPELPPDCHSDGEPEHDWVNGFDEPIDSCTESDIHVENEALQAVSHKNPECRVPSPEQSSQLEGQQAFAEYYSQVRISTHVQQNPQRVLLALDRLTGWDFRLQSVRRRALELLAMVWFLMLSPPSQWCSDLQRLFNYKKMTKESFQNKI